MIVLDKNIWIDLFVCFESHEQFFSYLATVTIAGVTKYFEPG
jgi:hypothetical protein